MTTCTLHWNIINDLTTLRCKRSIRYVNIEAIHQNDVYEVITTQPLVPFLYFFLNILFHQSNVNRWLKTQNMILLHLLFPFLFFFAGGHIPNKKGIHHHTQFCLSYNQALFTLLNRKHMHKIKEKKFLVLLKTFWCIANIDTIFEWILVNRFGLVFT